MASKVGERGRNEKKTNLKQKEGRTNEAFLEAARKRVEFEKRAQRIIERLLDKSISESFFEDCGKFITSKQFDDVPEERAIEKLCGYPLCDNKLKDIPSQQYHISLKSKKVYDITDRKNFCSQVCYQACKYYQAQLTDEPLWTRDHKSIPPIKLMDRDSEKAADKRSLRSHDEVEMKQQILKKSDIETIPDTKAGDFYGIDDEISDDLSTLSLGEQEKEKERRKVVSTETKGIGEHSADNSPSSDHLPNNPSSNQSLIGEDAGDMHDLDSGHAQCGPDQTSSSQSELVPTRSPDTASIASPAPTTVPHMDANASSDRIKAVQTGSSDGSGKSPDCKLENDEKETKGIEVVKKKRKKKKQAKNSSAENPMLIILKHVQQCLIEWRTEETIKHLYNTNQPNPAESIQTNGNDEIGGKEVHKSEPEQGKGRDFEAVTDFEREIKRRLDQEEGALAPASKPLPDFKKLSEEQEQYALRVEEFYAGFGLPPPSKPKADVSGDVSKDASNPVDRTRGLPPVDSRAQVTIRRKILLDRLGRVLPELVVSLQLSMREVSPEVTALVRTFQPASHNISFKPVGWTLLSTLLLHLLAERDTVIKEALETTNSKAFLTSMFRKMDLNVDIIHDFVHQFSQGMQH